MRALLTLPLLLAACGGSAPPASPTPSPASDRPGAAPAAPVQEQLAWMVGRWESATGIEHWTAAGDALFGISFTVDGGKTVAYEALLIRDLDGVRQYEAAPNGAATTAFALTRSSSSTATFENPGHDPFMITYVRSGDALAAEVQFQGDMVPPAFAWKLGPPGRAPELEAADQAWSDDVGRRGVDAWVDGFDPEGVQRPDRGPPITEPAARRKAMEPVLAGSFRLIWAPIASGGSPAGDLGYTVGTWRYLAGTVDKGHGAYMTIWRRQADGRWKALYDAGDPEALP